MKLTWLGFTSALAAILASGSAFSGSKPGTHERMPPGDRAAFLKMARPVAPYRIMGNLYYVGASDLTSFLIVTPQGHILLDAGIEEMAPQVEENIESLGFHVAGVKYLLNTQAHIDHAAGLAALKRVSGAKLAISRGDAPVIESGGAADFLWPRRFRWEPAKVDILVDDGDTLSLGGVTMTAHLTPGHTKGCTTWTTTVEDAGKVYNAVFVCSVSRVGAKLVGNQAYPRIAADYTHSFEILKNLPCDLFLAAHVSIYGGLAKARRLRNAAQPNPFIDPEGYRGMVFQQEKEFQQVLAGAQRAARAN